MKRVIALGLFALASMAACAFVFWPRVSARHAPMETPCAPGTVTPSVKVHNAPLTTIDHPPQVAPDADAWPRFLAACRGKEFSAAEQLLPSVVGLPVELRSELLAIPREQDWSETDAAALRKLAGSVLVVRDEREREVICSAALSEYEKCWPRLSVLNAHRTANMVIHVDGEPLNVPEREGLPAGDWLLVDALLAAMRGEATPLQQTQLLFEQAAAMSWTERTYFEPLLSGLVAALVVGAEAETRLLAAEFVESRNLTPRLCFELRLIVLGNSKAVRDFLKAIEPRHSKINEALRVALNEGLSSRELLELVVPYLESRFGSREAVTASIGPVLSWLNRLSPEDRWAFLSGATGLFEGSEPGSGLASIYFWFVEASRACRDSKELSRTIYEAFPDFSKSPRLVSSEDAQRLRAAILAHRAKVAGTNELLPIENLADLCDIAVECSSNLCEAVESLEILLTKRTLLEHCALRLCFARVIMRCRGRFPQELESDYVLRERLIRLSEMVLNVTLEELKARAHIQRDGLEELILLADQILALCALSPEIAVSSESAASIRKAVEEFEKECFDWQSNPPVIKPKYKFHLDPYTRVVARLKDSKLVPAR